MMVNLKAGKFFPAGEYMLKFDKYKQGGATSIQVWCPDGPMCMATVNVPGVELPPNHVLIKNWSENEGILEALIEAKVIVDTGITIPTGYVNANLCKLLK